MKAYVVDSAAVRSNLQILKDRAGSAVLWAVLKGDGYGLGLVQIGVMELSVTTSVQSSNRGSWLRFLSLCGISCLRVSSMVMG